MVIKDARDRLNRKSGVFQVQACRRCGLVVTRPRPTAAALAYYYEGIYSGHGAGRAELIQRSMWGRWVAHYRLRLVQSVRPLGRGERLLEVGCGYGAFLAAAKCSTGCEATGLDIDAACLAGAVHRDLIDYRCATLDNADLAPAQFDVVAFFESLEHHAEPVAALKAAAALLKPGGVCIVEVPNFEGAWRRVFGGWWMPLLVPQHLVHFSPATLRQTFEAAGLKVDRPHVSMFFPLESTASLGLWLNERLARPIRGYRLRWSRPDGAFLLLLILLWWLAVEVPAQAILALMGRSGVQFMAGFRK
ncbi:MAG: class I SAM-dependent methyltransferase [Ramlibacter sp.]